MKRELEGIEPYNRFWYRNCYNHSLIPALGHYGIAPEDVLRQDFAFCADGFRMEALDLQGNARLGKRLGYRVVKRSVRTRKQAIRLIDRGIPVIFGIDCFYLDSRAETYHAKHMPHYILMYGYDTDRDAALVVDHDYLNSFFYRKKEIPLGNLLDASREYACGIAWERPVCHLVLGRRLRPSRSPVPPWKDVSRLKLSLEACRSNLHRYLDCLEQGPDAVEAQCDRVTDYFTGCRSARMLLSKSDVIATLSGDAQQSVEELVVCYNFFLSLMWKMKGLKDFGFYVSRMDRIRSKLARTEELETLLHTAFIQGGAAHE